MTGRLPVEPLQIPVAAADDVVVVVVADFVADIVAVGDEWRWYRQPGSHC